MKYFVNLQFLQLLILIKDLHSNYATIPRIFKNLIVGVINLC